MIGMLIFNFFKGVYSFFKNIFIGIKKLPEKKSNFISLAIFTAAGTGLFLFKEKLWVYMPLSNPKLAPLKYLFYIAPGLPLLFLYWQGEDYAKFIAKFDEKFECIGFYGKGKRQKRNLNGEIVGVKDYPRFIGEQKDGKKVIYSFYTTIPLQEWKNKYRELETVLDCNIVKIENAKTTKQVIKLHTVPTDQGLKEYIPWSDEYIREEDFELVVGVAMLEDVVFDLNKVPHALIAGVTGSGKSVVLRCLLWQSIKKGAKIYMIDFKGGVEFGVEYERFGEVVTERQRTIEILKELVDENTARLNKFREMGVKNLGEYNKIAKEKLCRIMVFCDEVSEMLDKTGVSNEDKKVYAEIEKHMSTLARLARATGINMILATQRPDAKVIPGQIKNNLPIRISGRMVDPQASEMVLGNTKATDLSDIRGRFLYTIGADTFEFQAYYFDDSQLKVGNYQVGGMLTQSLESCDENPEPGIKGFVDKDVNEVSFSEEKDSNMHQFSSDEFEDEFEDFDDYMEGGDEETRAEEDEDCQQEDVEPAGCNDGSSQGRAIRYEENGVIIEYHFAEKKGR